MPIEGHAAVENLSRRTWLRGMLALGAVLAGGSAVVGCSAPPGAALPRLLCFDEPTARLVRSLAEAVIPDGPGFPDAATARLLERFDEELHFVAPDVRDDVLAALSVVGYLPLLYARLARFESLDVGARREVIRQAQRSRFEIVRAVASGLRMMLLFLYFGDQASWPAVGYDGPYGHLPQQLSEQRQQYARLTGRVLP